MSETNIEGATGDPFTDEEVADFIEHGPFTPDPEQAPYHTILEVWREVLKPAAGMANDHITPTWATRILSTYQGMTYADMPRFQASYFGKIAELLEIVLMEIESDPIALQHLTPEEDVEHNSHHYKNILLTWQLALTQWELDWDTTSPDAALEVGALSEVHKMFFGDQGLTQFLDNIKLEFTEADQAQLAEALEELKAGQGE